MLLLCVTAVQATNYHTWTESYSNDVGTKDLATKGASTSTTYGVISWTDGSSNTTVCADTIRCKYGSSPSSLGSYGAWKTSGSDLDTTAQYIDCQWNLTTSNASVSNCTVSNLKVAYEGYGETYATGDITTSTLDGIITVIASLVSFGAIIGLILIYKWVKKR